MKSNAENIRSIFSGMNTGDRTQLLSTLNDTHSKLTETELAELEARQARELAEARAAAGITTNGNASTSDHADTDEPRDRNSRYGTLYDEILASVKVVGKADKDSIVDNLIERGIKDKTEPREGIKATVASYLSTLKNKDATVETIERGLYRITPAGNQRLREVAKASR